MSHSPQQKSGVSFMVVIVAAVVIGVGCALGAKAITSNGGSADDSPQPVATIQMPTVPDKPVSPATPPPAPDPKEIFYAWARQEHGVKSIRADMSTVVVEFHDDKISASTKEQLAEIAKVLAQRWGTDNQAVYVNCRVVKGDEQITSGSWLK
ncbi:hypothetical protein DB346_10280 [Verrucomicrobia bacterium LW23]|nr:hypothetical protein DB346_10280 [Verrucomicrobia bacterium LW23]